MTRDAARARIVEIGIIPSVRTSSAEDARFAARTMAHAGIPIIEITMTVPGAVDVIADLARSVPDLIVGAGTIFDVETARRCAQAGAQFLTSPGLDLKIVEFALKEGVLAMPGALTPTEVTAAWQSGADLIKVFPCAQVGGASYIRALKAPFPDVPLVAAGGVNQQTAAEFIVAGAVAIGVGKELIPKSAVQERDERWITELARRFLNSIREARRQTVTRTASVDRR
jgi:2-dehydro-3-deoxyphosphogluconate aldolase / (4S)-4-hydroxy-2-oxoglutarate aldolase